MIGYFGTALIVAILRVQANAVVSRNSPGEAPPTNPLNSVIRVGSFVRVASRNFVREGAIEAEYQSALGQHVTAYAKSLSQQGQPGDPLLAMLREFKNSLDTEVRLGRSRGYRIAYVRRDSVFPRSGGPPVVGCEIGYAFREQNVIRYSLVFVYSLRGIVLKLQSFFQETGLNRRLLVHFAHDIVTNVASGHTERLLTRADTSKANPARATP